MSDWLTEALVFPAEPDSPAPPAPKFQWHVTGLSMLAKCGAQFERRYMRGERLPPGMGAITGKGVDSAVNHNLDTRINTGKPAEEAEVLDLARDTVKAEWENGVAEDADYKRSGGRLAQGRAIDDAVRLAELHYRDVAPLLDPLAVQREWVIDDAASGAQLVGTIDVLNRAKQRVQIIDTKTGKRSPNESVAYTSLQLTGYALALVVIDKEPAPVSVGLDYLVKTETAKYVPVRAERHLADFAHLAERLRRAEEIRKAGAFQPAPLDAWWCSADWCGYHSTCRFARKPKSVAVADVATAFQKSLELIQIERNTHDTDD